MKTLVVWSVFPEMVYFFVLEGDLSRFDDVYINGENLDECKVKQLELADIIYERDGEFKYQPLDHVPKEGWDITINAGMYL